MKEMQVMTTHQLTACVVAIAMIVTAVPAMALPSRGEPAPSFTAVDINGNRVSLDEVVAEADHLMVVLFFFSVDAGETLARRLRTLDAMHGKQAPVQRVEIIGIGYREDEAALRQFAEDLNIRYFIVESSGDEDEIVTGYGPIQTIPLTFLIDDDKLVMSVLRGGGEGEARILSRIAEQYLTKEPATATSIAGAALEEGEDAADAGALQGYGLAMTGQLSEAEEAFTRIDHKTGLAHVAVERGEYDAALELAGQASGDPFAHAVTGRALLLTGKLSEAAEAFDRTVSAEELAEWQRSQAVNGKGRALHAVGDIGTAVDLYEQASMLDGYNLVALSNQGAAHRELGNPEKAHEVLQAAATRGRDDALIAMMLRQVTQELEERNDSARQERIRQRISDLGQRWREMQESGEAAARDTWSSRPSIVAFLPTQTAGGAVFERAGLDMTLRREVETRLGGKEGISVVDRDMLDELLRELELSDAIGDPNTQLQLGRVLAARALATVDFASDGGGGRMFVRLIDTETTSILGTHAFEVPRTGDLNAITESVVENLSVDLAKRDGRLQGLVAGIRGDEVVLNLGSAHGVTEGMRFHALIEEEPMEVGGRTVPGRRVVVGTLEVTDVYDDFASAATVVSLDDGAELAAAMKIMAAAE